MRVVAAPDPDDRVVEHASASRRHGSGPGRPSRARRRARAGACERARGRAETAAVRISVIGEALRTALQLSVRRRRGGGPSPGAGRARGPSWPGDDDDLLQAVDRRVTARSARHQAHRRAVAGRQQTSAAGSSARRVRAGRARPPSPRRRTPCRAARARRARRGREHSREHLRQMVAVGGGELELERLEGGLEVARRCSGRSRLRSARAVRAPRRAPAPPS